MTVRHITRADNVDEEGFMIDTSCVHHGTIAGSRVATLAGPVDPTTHVNIDFPDHEMGECVIAKSLEVGAEVVLDENDQFARTRLRPGSLQSLGFVDQGARRTEWLAVLRERRS